MRAGQWSPPSAGARTPRMATVMEPHIRAATLMMLGTNKQHSLDVEHLLYHKFRLRLTHHRSFLFLSRRLHPITLRPNGISTGEWTQHILFPTLDLPPFPGLSVFDASSAALPLSSFIRPSLRPSYTSSSTAPTSTLPVSPPSPLHRPAPLRIARQNAEAKEATPPL